MSLDTLMQALARSHQMGELEMTNNRYRIVVDDRMEIFFFQANGRLFIHSQVCPLPVSTQERESLLVHLMQKNLPLCVSERVSLSIEPDGEHLALTLSQAMQGVDEQVLTESLESFCNSLEYFLKLVEGGGGKPIPSSAMIMP